MGRGCVFLFLVMATAVFAAAAASAAPPPTDFPAIAGAEDVTGAVITGCGECTIDATRRWCPLTMTCHAAENCSCGRSCLDFRSCYYHEKTCRGCLRSGGVYCTGPMAGKESPCFFPETETEPRKVNRRHPSARAKVVLPTCPMYCTMPNAVCISDVRDCKAEHTDSFLVAWTVAATGLSLAFTASAVVRLRWWWVPRQPGQETATLPSNHHSTESVNALEAECEPLLHARCC